MKARTIIFPAVLGLLILGGGCYYWYQQQEKRATVRNESVSEREESIRAAYVSGDGPAGAQDHVRFANITQDRFSKLARAIEEKDGDAMTAVISGKAMFDYAERAGLMDFVPSRQRRNVIQGMQKGLVKGLSNIGVLNFCEQVEVLRIEPVKENEFIAYTRAWNETLEVYTKMRWWFLGVGEKRWVIYDYEDFDTNIRASTLMSAAMASATKGGNGWAKDLIDLARMLQGADAENLLEKISQSEMKAKALLKHTDAPGTVKGFARVMLVSALITQERFQDAMDEVEIMLVEHPDIPVAHYSKGSAHLGLEQWDLAVESFTTYAGLLGWDSDVHELIADAYHGKGDFEKALDHAGKGLADNANAYGCLATYALSTTEDKRALILDHIQKTKTPEAAYEYVMDYAIQKENTALAKWMLGNLKTAFPKSDLIEYYEEALVEEKK